MKSLKNIWLYILPILLLIAGSLDFFGIVPVKTEMESMNLGGYKMIIVGVIDWILAIGILVKKTRPIALDGVLFIAFGSFVAHIVTDAPTNTLLVPILLFVMAITNLHINYKINFIPR
ncbi:DoxX family protein [Haliscomenobacter sp.]|uniref:DoxX family protein n=1 Tax=Haliscomenobacter sp. TaxID=2717303 RepID=UPI00336516EE